MQRQILMGAIMLASVASARANATAQSPCLSPRPLWTGCRSFVFFTTLGAVTSQRGEKPDLSDYGAARIGYMRNTDSLHSVGASAELGYGLAGRFSVKAHRRTWRPRGSLDVSGGLLLADILRPGNAGDERLRATGITADIATVSPGGVGFYAGADVIRGAGRTTSALHGGVQLESGWAIGAVLAAAALYGVVYLALSSGT